MREELGYQLVERLLLPLMRGGEVRLLPPLGGARARECSSMSCSPDQEEAIRRFKLAAARRIYPVDDVGCLEPSDWLLLSALNDTLQLTHPDLSRGRYRSRLFELTAEVIRQAGEPKTPLQALSRHALFARLLELSRRDQHVSWWAGSRSFVGRRPPRRLLLWRTLRRVRVRSDEVRIAGVTSDPFQALLDDWLAATPLTRLLGATAVARFSWSESTLRLVSEPHGRSLALRAILLSEQAHALRVALDSAVPKGDRGAAEVAGAFAAELSQRLDQTRRAVVSLSLPGRGGDDAPGA